MSREAQANTVLGAITHLIEINGFPPTRKELAKHMGWSSANSAQIWLERLESMGKIKLVPNVSRGIILIEEDSLSVQ